MASIVDELKSASISTNEKIDRAIKKINASAQFAIVDNSVDKIVWADGTSPISKSDIEAKYSEVEAEWNAEKYKGVRAASYPDLGDQLDALYKDILAGKVDATGEFAKAIKKVKDDNPKS